MAGQIPSPPDICLSSFLKASHRLRDLSLVHSGYLFSRSGQFLLKPEQEEAPQIVLAEAAFGMKFDARTRLYVIEIAEVRSAKLSLPSLNVSTSARP